MVRNDAALHAAHRQHSRAQVALQTVEAEHDGGRGCFDVE